MLMKKRVLWMLSIVGLISFALSIWLDFSKGFSSTRTWVFAICYLGLLTLLVRTIFVKLPRRLELPFITGGLNLSEVLEAVLCVLAACAWAYVIARLPSDALWVVALEILPAIALVLLGAMFFFRSMGPPKGS